MVRTSGADNQHGCPTNPARPNEVFKTPCYAVFCSEGPGGGGDVLCNCHRDFNYFSGRPADPCSRNLAAWDGCKAPEYVPLWEQSCEIDSDKISWLYPNNATEDDGVLMVKQSALTSVSPVGLFFIVAALFVAALVLLICSGRVIRWCRNRVTGTTEATLLPTGDKEDENL